MLVYYIISYIKLYYIKYIYICVCDTYDTYSLNKGRLGWFYINPQNSTGWFRMMTIPGDSVIHRYQPRSTFNIRSPSCKLMDGDMI